jgi:ABC-2 type transport system permease protein
VNVRSRRLDGVPGNSPLKSLPRTSISRRISPLRACTLMLGLRLTRLRNRLLGGRGTSSSHLGSRPAAARQAGSGWLSLGLTLGGLPVLTGYGVLLGQFLPQMYAAGAHGVIPTASAHLVALMVAALCMGLGLANKDLNRLDGDMQWLLTLPASIPSLYGMKLAERTLLSLYSWIIIYPLVVAMALAGEFSWPGALAAILISLPLFLLVALGYILVESAARVWLPKVAINSMQLAGTLCGLALVMAISTRPDWVSPLGVVPWPSVSQAVGLAFSDNFANAVVWHLTRYCLETAALLGAGYLLLSHIASRGAVVGAGAAQGRRGAASLAPLRRGLFGRGMVHKELLQLVRDKKTLHMALVVPPVLLFPLFLLARKPSGERLFASPIHLPALAFLAGAMAVMMAANVLHAEGKALWLLFTLPRSLSRMLAEKAVVWVPLCLAYAALVLAYGVSQQGPSRELVFGSAYCFFGLTLLTMIGVALGLHAVDPLAMESEENSNRGGQQVLLLWVLLAAFGAGFYGDAWLRISLCVLLMAATYGVWQDASRRLPYLLEPELRPAPRIGVTDGLVCVLLILLLEVFGARLVAERFELGPWPAQGVTFVAAVSIVGAGASFMFWRRGLHDLRGSLGLTWGGRSRVALQRALRWAVPAAVVAVVSALALRYWPWLQSSSNGAAAVPSVVQPLDWLILLSLTCFGAPVVEELLFRGMIYRGLRESLSPRVSACFAAGVFAAIHPGTAFIPLFLLSLFAAASFERSRSLLSPMLVHLAYNASLFIVSGIVGGA